MSWTGRQPSEGYNNNLLDEATIYHMYVGIVLPEESVSSGNRWWPFEVVFGAKSETTNLPFSDFFFFLFSWQRLRTRKMITATSKPPKNAKTMYNTSEFDAWTIHSLLKFVSQYCWSSVFPLEIVPPIQLQLLLQSPSLFVISLSFIFRIFQIEALNLD